MSFLCTKKQPEFRGDELREGLAILPKLDKTRVGVVLEIALCERTKADKLLVMPCKEGEVRRCKMFRSRDPPPAIDPPIS